MTNKYAPIIEKLKGYHLDSSQVRSPLDEAHLNKIEAQLGHPLPSDYREFLRDFAGIRFDSAGFFCRGYGNGYIDFFQGSRVADNHHLTREIFIPVSAGPGDEPYPGIHLVSATPYPVAEELGWPEELLIIAYDGGGNPICLTLYGPRPGAIFYWVWGDDIYLVADSFDEFMQLLQPL